MIIMVYKLPLQNILLKLFSITHKEVRHGVMLFFYVFGQLVVKIMLA